MKNHLPAHKEFFRSAGAFNKKMRSRKKKLYNKHIDRNGHLHLPIYIKSLIENQHAMIIPDEELYSFLKQIEHSLRPYKSTVPANIYIYTPDEFSDEFCMLFLRCVQNTAHAEFLARRAECVRNVIYLFVFFLLGMGLYSINDHLMAEGLPVVLTTSISVICNVLLWELIDYTIRTLVPSIRDLCRIIQIATAKFTIRQWD